MSHCTRYFDTASHTIVQSMINLQSSHKFRSTFSFWLSFYMMSLLYLQIVVHRFMVSPPSVLGLTPLHVAVLSHNAVVQELSRLESPQSPQTAALMQRRKLLGECINTLMLMGASFGTTVRDTKPVLRSLKILCHASHHSTRSMFLPGSQKRTHRPAHGSRGSQR